MGSHKTVPPTRSTLDSHAFMKDEKFDTWLDLGPLYELQKFCAQSNDWDVDHFSSLYCIFSRDTLALLDLVNVSPAIVSKTIITPCLPSRILYLGLTTRINECHMSPSSLVNLYNTANLAAQLALGLQVTHVMRNMSPGLLRHASPSLTVWDDKMAQFPSHVHDFARIVEDMMRILEAYKIISEYCSDVSAGQRARKRLRNFERKYNTEGLSLSIPSLGASIILSLDVSILKWGTDTYLLTHKYLLEIINKVNETYCALLYSHMVSGTSLSPRHYVWVTKFLTHISNVVQNFCTYSNNPDNLHHENKAFTYLKVIEGIGVACIMLREDHKIGWYNDELIQQLWQSVVDEGLQNKVDYTESALYRLFCEFDVASIAEVLGLVKLCGHPSIEIFRGLAKLKERTHANIIVNEAAVRRTIGVMKRELIINFRRKRNKYPNIRFNPGTLPRGLSRLIDRNISPDSEEGLKIMSGVTIEHWYHIDLEKNDEFDPIDNQLVLLKDKALGMTRSKVFQKLLSPDNGSSGAGLGPIEERRALLAFLLSDHFNLSFRQYMDHYENDEDWDSMVLDYLVIKLTAKELEEKPEGRMFGASPAEERNRRVVQEENTMRVMDNFFRDQLMTPDELQMLRKLFSFRHFNKMYPHHKLLQVSFDFSKWNNNMRSASIDVPAKATLDKWFGTKIYGKTMRAYEHSLFYYKDMLRQDHWDGQLGGIEGLNQATWSVIFLCGIKQALEGLGVIYQLTVKGDDVRAALVIPEKEFQSRGIIKIKDSILNQLSELCKDMGWQLNPHECFVSQSVIATSKQYQVNDTFLPAATKKIIKMESLSNLIFPTTEDMVASIFSTAHSACSQATTVLPAFASALYVACRLLAREMWSVDKMSVEDIAMLAMWPQCLGGPGSLPLQTFFVRGENDMLSVSISLLRSLVLSEESGLQKQVTNILSQKLKLTDDLTLLVTDPYSISLNVPERPNAVLRRLMRAHMPYWVKNPDLLTLLTLDAQKLRQEFLDHITSMRPYVAKVVTTLWETSPFYIIEEVLSKFMESSTIFSFFAKGRTGRVSTKKAHRTLSRILIAARKRKIYWVRTLKDHNQSENEWFGVDVAHYMNNHKCTTQIVHMIREASWGFKIKGITYPSLADQNLYYTPTDLISRNARWAADDISTTILLEHDRSVYQTTDCSLHYAACPGLAPWLGAQTSSKLELPNISTRITSPAINKILRLINLKVNAQILGREFVITIDMLIKSLTGINLEHLRELIPEAGGGHISHRVAINSFSVSTMPNSRPNTAQLVKLSSDAGAALRGDVTNRTVNFAARHFYSIIMALWPLQSQLRMPDNYPTTLQTIFHNDVDQEPEYKVCPWCCNDVDDGRVSFLVKQRPLLADFRFLSLVGCSEFEEKTLRKNMSEALTGKIRRTAQHDVQNVNDPQLVDIATHILIRKLNKERMKIFEAAQGANFACTPRAELLEIMSVAMGIKSVSSVSLNIIRLLPAESLYRSVLTEIISFCVHWLAITTDPENLYQIENLMDHLNPLGGLFDSLLAAQVMPKVRSGAIQHGLPDFKWTASSFLSGGAAMKCFFMHHKKRFEDWINGISPLPEIKIFTQLEDNETIFEALERDYFRVIQATVNRANRELAGFRMSSLWRRVLTRIREDNVIMNELIHISEDPHFSMANTYVPELCEFLVQHFIDGVLENMGIFANDDYYEFWVNSYMCVMAENYLERGEWTYYLQGDEFTHSEIMLFNIKQFGALDFLEIPLNILCEQEFFQKWSRMFTSEELLYIRNITSLSVSTCPDQVMYGIQDRYNQMETWLNTIRERRIMIMTQDNAEIILKSTDVIAENIIDDHLYQLEHPDPNKFSNAMLDSVASCTLSENHEHTSMLAFTKPLQMQASLGDTHYIERNRIGLAYDDIPPPDQFFVDPTELMRGSGIHNTSVAKYLEIIDKLRLHRKIELLGSDAAVVCLADGLGGVTARFLATYPELCVVYNSMYYNTKSGKRAVDAHEAIPPTEVTSLPARLDAQKRLCWKGMFPGDLTNPDVQSMVVNAIMTKHRIVAIVTMDADIPWHDNLQTARDLWYGALWISAKVHHHDTIHIFKCFGIHHPIVIEVCHTVLSLYSHVHMYRASYTRQRSTEFFLIFSNPRNGDTLVDELELQHKGIRIFARSLQMADLVTTRLNHIGSLYMNFRSRGINNIIDISHHMMRFVKARAYPLDLTNSMMSLKVNHPVPKSCLCMLLHNIMLSVSHSLLQAKDNLQVLKIQMQHKHIQHVGLRIGHKHDITTGWKGIQMSLRRAAKLMMVKDWITYVVYHRGEPITQWTKTEIDNSYLNIYYLLQDWKGYVAPIRVGNSLMVCCERFNDNWTMMFASAIRKCQQLWGSILLCIAYVYKRHPFAEEALSYLSHNISIDKCCQIHSAVVFGQGQNWRLSELAISLAAPVDQMIPNYLELPGVEILIRDGLLMRGSRTYAHRNTEIVDPNLQEQVNILIDQPDEELLAVANEFND